MHYYIYFLSPDSTITNYIIETKFDDVQKIETQYLKITHQMVKLRDSGKCHAHFELDELHPRPQNLFLLVQNA